MIALLLLGCGPKIDRGPAAVATAQEPVRIVQRPDATGPDVYFDAMIAAGSARDPIGREGLASLTARSMVEGGAASRSGAQIKEALYPTGNRIDQVIDREWVSFRLACHKDQASLCLEIFADVLTAPRFDDADVARMRDDALYDVTSGLLSDEEALGSEVLNAWLFEGHPYGHPVDGRAGVLPLLDRAMVQGFYQSVYVRESMVVGLAGAYDPALEQELEKRLLAVPTTRAPELVLQQPEPVKGRSMLALDTTTPVTGFYLGHPLAVRRSDPDWPALYLAMVAFGEHRQSHGRLFRHLRTDRGLNYGDYAYAEPYVQRGYEAMPEQGTLRQQPYFYLWLRPTAVENGPFLLKGALLELEELVDKGLLPDEFERIRTYALARLPLFATDPGRRLAYALDTAATGEPDPLVLLPDALRQLTVEQVNDAIKRNIHPEDLRIVAVSGDARALVDTILEGKETPIVYVEGINPGAEQTSRDAEIARKSVGIAATEAKVVPAEGIFE
jgi:zinc protease